MVLFFKWKSKRMKMLGIAKDRDEMNESDRKWRHIMDSEKEENKQKVVS